MSKNYKVIVFREPNCSPCELLGTLPSGSAASKGYEYEEVELIRKTQEEGDGWFLVTGLLDEPENQEDIGLDTDVKGDRT